MADEKFSLSAYDNVRNAEMREAVFQAIGAASICWTETPSGIFDSDFATEIGEELLIICAQYAAQYHIDRIRGTVVETPAP